MAITLQAYLTIDGAAAAIEFYKTAFGAEEVRRVPADDGKRLMHAEIRVFGQSVLMSDAFPEYGNIQSPTALGGTTFNMIASLEARPDVDAAIAKAEAQIALDRGRKAFDLETAKLMDQYDLRSGLARNPMIRADIAE